MNDFEQLLGRTVERLDISADKTSLVFHLVGGGVVCAHAYGDCCSASWFEHVNGVEALLGAAVTRVVPREMPSPTWNDDEYEQTAYYGWTIETVRGRCDIEMRNSSNGYYGGYVEFTDAPPVGETTEDLRQPVTVDL